MDGSSKKLILSHIIDNSKKRHENFKLARLMGILNNQSYQEILEDVVDHDVKIITYLTRNNNERNNVHNRPSR